MRQLRSPRCAVSAGRPCPALDVAGVTADSRQVVPGDLFAALPGSACRRPRLHRRRGGARRGRRAGARRHRLAARRAAAAADPGSASRAAGWRRSPPCWPARSRRPWSRSPAPTARPARSSSCARSGRSAAARPPASARSGVIAPGFDPGPGLTTPDPVTPGRDPGRTARAPACTHAAMEASSHGLDQFRLDGVRLAAGALHQPDARPSGLSRHRWRPIAPPSCGCSPSCCRRARRRSRMPTWTRRRWRRCATIADAAPAGSAHGRRGRRLHPPAGRDAAPGRPGADGRSATASARDDRAAAARPLPGRQRAAGGGAGDGAGPGATRSTGCPA